MKRVKQLLYLAVAMGAICAESKPGGQYYLGMGTLPDGYTRITDRTDFSSSRGHGWLNGQLNLFAVELPEGNYRVDVTFESPEAAAAATVKAEARRLMLKSGVPVDGNIRSFSVNIRRPEIEGGGSVKLNDREKNPMSVKWDELLTLEFLPGTAGLTALRIAPDPDAITVYLAGDSTVTDQSNEPWCGWGQMLPVFFGPGVAFANHAESGRALFSFLWEKRFEKILSTIRPGDYLFIQFGHNDQKDKREGSGPFTTYRQELEEYIARIREKKANPVLVTPMERRRWDGEMPGETLTEYAKAVRLVGLEQDVPVIDLHAMSLKFYAALGPADSKKAFVHYPANSFPGQDTELKDDTHHNVYGGYELARCMVEGIRKSLPGLAEHLRADAGTFDPSHPDNPGSLDIPVSGVAGAEKPEGS